MSNAGYGNHDAPPPGSATAERPAPESVAKKPGAGATDRPGMDLGGAGDLSRPSGIPSGSRSHPNAGGKDSNSGASDEGSPPLSHRRDVATPGAGTLPAGGQGDEVDPGAG